jgi:hypothetical protein
MHTLKVIAAGFILLGLFLLAGRLLGGGRAGASATAAKYFIPVWLAGAAINMWLGVSGAGYSVRDEAAFFVLNFAIPAAAAAIIWWRF